VNFIEEHLSARADRQTAARRAVSHCGVSDAVITVRQMRDNSSAAHIPYIRALVPIGHNDQEAAVRTERQALLYSSIDAISDATR
jgi:hypothetical protein